ncbi:hypothetical protein BIFGAL_02793 [Bifidobacterium gallicum DSM 20093 = LMG 11596]|uniref:Uncharacterized protein n=1 Tax=Bifidobacterium gallicum DSM 20093 = LMG 11596 TaxID=561180 RepID=D1NSN4_9BIFI|nr:hypothetical protein BIFGAL_02793 [Bifidobacterium gallicum DSM 20093 = LMG 11596]
MSDAWLMLCSWPLQVDGKQILMTYRGLPESWAMKVNRNPLPA